MNKLVKPLLCITCFGGLFYITYKRIPERRIIRRSWLSLKFSTVITFNTIFAVIGSPKPSYAIVVSKDEQIVLVKDNFSIRDEPFIKNKNYEVILFLAKDAGPSSPLLGSSPVCPSNFPIPSNSNRPAGKYARAGKPSQYRAKARLKPMGHAPGGGNFPGGNGDDEPDWDDDNFEDKKDKKNEQCSKETFDSEYRDLPKFKIESRIDNYPNLKKKADHIRKNPTIAKELERLKKQLEKGNFKCGIGTMNLANSNGIRYARGKNGSRIFFKSSGNVLTILAEADKSTEKEVIAYLLKYITE